MLGNGRFYVLPTRVLDEKMATQKSIALSSLFRLGPQVATYFTLGDAVCGAVRSLRDCNP